MLGYNYIKDYYKMIAIQQINFTGNLDWNPIANAIMFFIFEEAKEIILDFSQGTVKVF